LPARALKKTAPSARALKLRIEDILFIGQTRAADVLKQIQCHIFYINNINMLHIKHH
jgi:hypothetical protein